MITFEKIRELERNERETKTLQRLPENIMDEFRDYLIRKESIKNKTDTDIREIENAKNTIKRIMELREHKLLDLAMYSARSGMPVENLTKEEEELFNKLVEHLKAFRKNLFVELNTARKKEEMMKKEKFEKEIKATDEKRKPEKYKVLRSLPRFVGPDMKEYVLERGSIIEIPSPLSDLLLKKGVIEKVDEK